MENWSYKRNGAVEGPVSKDRLKALYDAGEITHQTLVRGSSSGGGWRRYGDVADLQTPSASPRIPRAVKNLWPWFVFGMPVIGGLIDVFLIQSKGNEFVEFELLMVKPCSHWGEHSGHRCMAVPDLDRNSEVRRNIRLDTCSAFLSSLELVDNRSSLQSHQYLPRIWTSRVSS